MDNVVAEYCCTYVVRNCYVITLLIVYVDILIPRDVLHMRMQLLPGLEVWQPGIEARCILHVLSNQN